jgi:hypothetical protein
MNMTILYSVRTILTGDLNGNKKLPLPYTSIYEPNVYLMFDPRDGVIRVRLRYTTDKFTGFMVGVDHSVGNKSCLVWTLEKRGSIQVLAGATFNLNASLIPYPTEDLPKSNVVNDFNSDGFHDLILLNRKED